ncbi:CoA transferase subunit A [Bacillus aquiflavi]|uniref:CoA transferase subunit A n=1 Tax=Bacillus aquiflavi TaxID=2672567 RepID=A0A6B3VZJ0_9BACI|nr:3-oxoacid CoA-transferase subunit A [Bacillus aquiflavi]MBA4536796.1 CoA transferase subunit A [Bacillus aquiflavi]NEY81163.1 CoA transferase subunit A [Bacillus aquiflavi]UAC49724.1 3-oxoacid CoA-transferase subunit A [Bacillus aquiflavi]
MEKLIQINEAINLINSDDVLLVGGFGLSGTPLTLIDAIAADETKGNFTVISNNLGEEGRGLGKLLIKGKLKKVVGSYFTTNRDAVKAWSKGILEIELIPQGTLAEAIRCGGAGIGGFYTKTAVGTKLAEGKEHKMIDGETFVFEKAIKGDVALIKALKADRLGNLIYDKTARNFNPLMATAAKKVIAEVDEVVEVGEISPDEVITPHLHVDYLVLSHDRKKGGSLHAKKREY